MRISDWSSDVCSSDLKILDMLTSACPEGAIISFDFDGKLHVHVDVHSFEDILKVEGALPILGGGMFYAISRGETPHRPFHHRLSAIVARCWQFWTLWTSMTPRSDRRRVGEGCAR